jgi:GTP-binding protein LepA
MERIRNFSIVAHIDHGKSTLADRFIQRAALVDQRDFRDQMLDSMDLERERGITIKSNTVTLPYEARDGKVYTLNLIDTPGHVDFTYEVSRALASCEGVLLMVDATQGVEAQTLAHLYSALEHDLEIIPVINKIDLPAADVQRAKEEIAGELGLDPDEAVCCSAKTGEGVEDVLEALVLRIPAPESETDDPLRALVFDANYDPFRGTIVSCRVFSNSVGKGDEIRLMHNDAAYTVEEVGVFKLRKEPRKRLQAGEVGYVIAGMKTISDVRIGDTITHEDRPAEKPLPGFREIKPMVFASVYPVSTEDYQALVDALERYKLNDASLEYQKDSSAALGPGFRCGFLGLLHVEIFQERLGREYDQSTIMTLPSVSYRFTMQDGEVVYVDNPAHYPDPAKIEKAEEPFVRSSIMVPEPYMGAVMNLCMEKRGQNPTFRCPSPGRLEIRFDMPLAEIIYDFYDKLKTVTQGYGSFDYEFLEYRESELVKVEILVNGEPLDALAAMVHRDRARPRALHICEKLKEELPRQMFKIPIQGAIGGKIIARTTVPALRKDVTAKCYGGDVSRKRKLLEKQKKGKKRMKMVGKVAVPQRAFVAVLKADTD